MQKNMCAGEGQKKRGERTPCNRNLNTKNEFGHQRSHPPPDKIKYTSSVCSLSCSHHTPACKSYFYSISFSLFHPKLETPNHPHTLCVETIIHPSSSNS